ncbi:Na/Pi cotransporter family protein [Paraburkholderia oxyphila]|uniref:Na/Pi cotransporter family protein n=1 Tax=Paraburkholderia oxyphila TaxID=614212 RepID=UPI000AA4F102|nr:Na/Pi symporter [Paraburkholderia oxyphila]
MILIVLHLAGGVALLTWGLHMVESGLMRAFGASLRRFMARSLGNRFNAFCAGLAITGALQSSTATGMIASSFAARGLMAPVTGLAIMLGANVGSTLIVQAFALDLSWISPACVLVGMVLFERGKDSRNRDIGRASIGLGLMLLALTLLVSTVQPAETAPALRTVLGALAGEPVLNAALACVLTWAAHSSIPVVLFVMSLANLHSIPMDSAIAMVLVRTWAARSTRTSKPPRAKTAAAAGCRPATCCCAAACACCCSVYARPSRTCSAACPATRAARSPTSIRA